MSSGRSSSDQAKFLLPALPSKPCVKLLPPEFVPTLTRGSVQSAYLYDVLDHISTSTQNLTYYEKVLSRSHTNFLTQVSIQCEQPLARYSGWPSLPSPPPSDRDQQPYQRPALQDDRIWHNRHPNEHDHRYLGAERLGAREERHHPVLVLWCACLLSPPSVNFRAEFSSMVLYRSSESLPCLPSPEFSSRGGFASEQRWRRPRTDLSLQLFVKARR